VAVVVQLASCQLVRMSAEKIDPTDNPREQLKRLQVERLIMTQQQQQLAIDLMMMCYNCTVPFMAAVAAQCA
jgi:hypothetical protein